MRGQDRIALTERDRHLIGLVSRFRLLSRDQLMALAPFRSLTRANTRLASLVRAGLLSRKVLPIYPGKGSAQSLYYLGTQSVNATDALSHAPRAQVRQIARWDLRQVEHVLAANQVLVDFLTAVQAVVPAVPTSFRSDPELRQIFADSALVPDGWFAWTEVGRRFNCFVEVDLHHEGLREWRSKVLRYLEYAESGLHQDRFGFNAFRVCVIARTSKRLASLRQIAEAAGRLFLFGEARAVTAQQFFNAVWLAARGTAQVRLVEG
jgi:Replication-relaxation